MEMVPEERNDLVAGGDKEDRPNGEHIGNGVLVEKKPLYEAHDETPRRRCCVRMSGGTRMLVMLTMTFAYFVVEIVFGYTSHSMALIADSFHMLSDVMALSIAFACLKISQRSSKKNTFGWVRAEVLGALINGVFLLALCFSIFIESLTRLVEPERIKQPLHVLFVGIIGCLINFVGIFMFHGHSHGHTHGSQGESSEQSTVRRRTHATIDDLESQHLMSSHQEGAMALAQLNEDTQADSSDTEFSYSSKKDSDIGPKRKEKAKRESAMSSQLNMRGVFLHVLSDAIGSVIVIITALVSLYVPGYGWLKLYLDPLLSLAMVGLIVSSTLPLVRETALILMQTTPGFIKVKKIEASLLKIEGVLAVHEFHVWRLVGERIIGTVHIRFSDLKAYIAAADEIRTLFHDNSIHSTTIQPEFSEMADTLGINGGDCAFTCSAESCKRMDVTCCKRVNTDSPTSSVGKSRRTDSDSSSGGSLGLASF